MSPLPGLLLMAAAAFAGPRNDAGPGQGPEPFTCCDVARVRSIVDQYVDLVEAIVEGETDSRISANAYALRANLKPDSALDAEENALVVALEQRVNRVRNSAEQIRAELPEIGRGVIFLALRHEGGSLTVVEAHCPQRGPWLQRSTTALKSPFGGSCARWR